MQRVSSARTSSRAPLGKLIIAPCRLVAARAHRGRTLARSYGDFDALVIWTEPGAMMDKAPESMATV